MAIREENLLKELIKLRGAPITSIDPAEIACEEVSDPQRLCKDPLVSVLMITYNHECYIAEALDSILHQETTFQYELIIGEDCSRDRTRELVLDYQQRFPHIIRVLHSRQNIGPCANIWRVEQACRGKYVAYCEGDDFWQRRDKLQLQADFLDEHQACAVVYSGYDLVRGGTKTVVSTVPEQSSDRSNIISFDHILFGNRFQFATCTCFALARIVQEAHETCPILKQKLSFGDVTRHLLFAANGQVGFIPDSLGTYRINAGGVSQKFETRLRFVFDGLLVKLWFLQKCRSGLEDGKRQLIRQCFPYVFYFAEHFYDPQLIERLINLANFCGYRVPRWMRWKLAMCGNRFLHRIVRTMFKLARQTNTFLRPRS